MPNDPINNPLNALLDAHDANFANGAHPLHGVTLIKETDVRGIKLKPGVYDYDARDKSFRQRR